MSFPAPKPIAYNALTIEWQRSREAATVYKWPSTDSIWMSWKIIN
jgi:hypothetical protein